MASRRSERPASPLPDKIGTLLQESRWLGVGAVALFLSLALWGFRPSDPGWSHAVAAGPLQNPTGRAGARWPRIAWCSADTVVTLDETNLLGPAVPDPARLYNLILETLYGVVVPGLIVRLVDWIRRGEAVPLGPALLRPEGLVFSGRTFHWPSGAAVPYSQLTHALDDGEFVVLWTGDENDTERFALAEVWNAAIAGHVIDALASVTPPTDDP